MSGNVPKPGDDVAALEKGLEPSGIRVPVLLVFWREGHAVDPSRPLDPSVWHVQQFAPRAVKNAQRFAKAHGTQVVASHVDVPRFAVEGWPDATGNG